MGIRKELVGLEEEEDREREREREGGRYNSREIEGRSGGGL